MIEMIDTDNQQKLNNIIAEVTAAIAAELTPPVWIQRDYGFHVDGWGWSGDPVIRAHGKHHWGWTGETVVSVSAYSSERNHTLPKKSFSIGYNNSLSSDWRTTLAKAIALAQKRAAIVIADREAATANQRRKEEYETQLSQAIAAANLPTDCWEADPYEDDKQRLRIVKPRLDNGELKLVINQTLNVDSEQAARLTTINGRITVSVKEALTVDEWLTLRDIFLEENND